MDITDLNKIHSEIRTKCDAILKQYGQLEIALKKDNDIIRQIKRKAPQDTKETIVEKIKMYLDKQVQDARNFTSECKTFFKITNKGFKPDPNCEFLLSIWKGDAYGKKGIDALKLLCEDMDNQLKSIYSKSIIEKYPFEITDTDTPVEIPTDE
jgi:hypothetical protein